MSSQIDHPAADPSDMLGAVEGLPRQCADAWALVERCGLTPGGLHTDIGVLGMGGSGISGDVAAMVVEGESPVPVWVRKSAVVPAFVNKSSFVVAVSYSGNTVETLSAYRQAVANGAEVVCVCSGGRLLEMATSDGNRVIRVPAGMQPRAALGYLALTVSGVVAMASGVSVGAQVLEAVSLLESMALEMGRNADSSINPARQMAARMLGTVPIIYGASLPAEVAARRWKCQINENAKVPAFCHGYPELGHNELVGWAERTPLKSTAHLVALVDEAVENEDMEVALDIASAGVAGVTRVRSRGSSPLARCMSLAYVGDFVSVYLALAVGIDPTPVEAIDQLKARIGKVARP